jgi:hypothetical protein
MKTKFITRSPAIGKALFGIGLIITYSTRLGKSHLDFSARWDSRRDVDVSNRVAGDGFNFSASLKFDVCE